MKVLWFSVSSVKVINFKVNSPLKRPISGWFINFMMGGKKSDWKKKYYSRYRTSLVQFFFYLLYDKIFSSSDQSALLTKRHWSRKLKKILSSRSQSFTSLMVDLRQDTNRVSSFSKWLNVTFPWWNCSVKTLVH